MEAHLWKPEPLQRANGFLLGQINVFYLVKTGI